MANVPLMSIKIWVFFPPPSLFVQMFPKDLQVSSCRDGQR